MSDLDFSCGGLLSQSENRDQKKALLGGANQSWLTYRELRHNALELAKSLVRPTKSLVFLLVKNDQDAVLGLLAAAAAGHAIALLDESLEREKLQSLMAEYEPDIILGSKVVSDLDVASSWGVESAGGVYIAKNPEQGAKIHKELFILLSTSGTTGSAKFVRLSYKAVRANAQQISKALDITSKDIGIGHLPLHYSYGFSILTSHFLMEAGFAIINDAITDPTFWGAVESAGGTHFPGVPFHYSVLGRLGMDLVPKGVRTFTQAGGALDVRMQKRVQEKIEAHNGRFYVMYGQTEAAPRMTTLPYEIFSEKIGSAGMALEGGRLEIQDENGSALPEGEIGHVHYYGPNVMMGYAVSRADLTKGDEEDSHLDTGDLGYLDGDGCLFITGRIKRFAKIAGLRLGLDEIERQVELVAPVAAIDGGEKIFIFHEGADEDKLKSFLKALAIKQKIPINSFRAKHINALPRKESGKTDYAELKRIANV